MAVQFEIISPLSDAIDVPNNAEIIFRTYSDIPIPIETIDVFVQVYGGTPVLVFTGVESTGFSNDWTGEVIKDDNTDITLVLIRPINDPNYPSGAIVFVNASANEE